MSPNSTPRQRPTVFKIALCASALILTALPTACGAAYADSESGHAGHSSSGEVEVGGADAAEPRSDEDEKTADNAEDDTGQNAGQGEDQGGDAAGGEEDAPAGDDAKGAGEDENKDENKGGDKEGGDKGGDAGQDVLGTDCSNSDLQPHDGFQKAPRCVETSFGEVAAEDKSPSLLISDAPDTVRAEEEFTFSVSTRNLVRDRFLGAAAGGYYKESSFLTEDGIQRGHFHTACRMLESLDTAPDAAPEPEFFLATQDNGGGAAPDTVQITVDGLPSGTAQCAVWAGDGSHRIPMMQRADQIPAFDVVRITVE